MRDVAAAVREQLDEATHLGPGDVALLLTAADIVDTAAALVDAGEAAPLPALQTCRYLADMLRKATPPAAPEQAGGLAALTREWLDD